VLPGDEASEQPPFLRRYRHECDAGLPFARSGFHRARRWAPSAAGHADLDTSRLEQEHVEDVEIAISV